MIIVYTYDICFIWYFFNETFPFGLCDMEIKRISVFNKNGEKNQPSKCKKLHFAYVILEKSHSPRHFSKAIRSDITIEIIYF